MRPRLSYKARAGGYLVLGLQLTAGCSVATDGDHRPVGEVAIDPAVGLRANGTDRTTVTVASNVEAYSVTNLTTNVGTFELSGSNSVDVITIPGTDGGTEASAVLRVGTTPESLIVVAKVRGIIITSQRYPIDTAFGDTILGEASTHRVGLESTSPVVLTAMVRARVGKVSVGIPIGVSVYRKGDSGRTNAAHFTSLGTAFTDSSGVAKVGFLPNDLVVVGDTLLAELTAPRASGEPLMTAVVIAVTQ